MMALEDVDALVKAAVDAEHKRMIEKCTEVIDIHIAGLGKEREEAVKAAVEEEHKRGHETLMDVLNRAENGSIDAEARLKAAVEAARIEERELCLEAVNEEMSMVGLLGPRAGRPMYLVLNDDLDGQASPVDCVWSAHATLHEAVAQAEENLEDPEASLMAVLEIQPGKTPKHAWVGGNGDKNGKRWGRYSNTP